MPRWLPAIALVALVALSFAARWHVLAASPFPLGVDGYFYPIELRSLLETGHLAYPASPLAFYLMAPFAAATDPIVGAKLAAAFYGALIALPAYGVGARIGGGRAAGLVAAAVATTSTGSTYLSIEFVKNGIGLTVALASLWLVLRAIEQPTRARIAAAVASAIAAYATHKMAGGLVVVIAVPAAIAGHAGRGRLRGRRLLYVIAACSILALLAVVVGLVFPERFLSPHDVGLVRQLVASDLHWTAPALALDGGDLVLGYEALAGLIVGIGAIVAHAVARPATIPREAAVVGWIAVGLAIALGLPFLAVTDREGLGFRLRIAAFVPLALAAAVLARHLLAKYGELAIVVALVLALRMARDRVEGEIVVHPALVTSALALRVPAGATLIVPERHIAFMVAWYARADVATRPDAIPREHRYRLLPLHFIGDGWPLDRALLDARNEPALDPPLGVHPTHPNGLVLVPEATWDWALARLPPRDRQTFAAWPTI